MFNADKLYSLATAHKATLVCLNTISQKLRDRFSALDDAVHALVLAVASGEPLLFIGPPGTGKSRLIRAFCVLTGLLKDEERTRMNDDVAYFEYLLTPFTEPGELFGFWNFAEMQNGKMKREGAKMMQQAKVVYLDEVFNGSSAILNSILTFMNERLFHDRGAVTPVNMECLFGATNQVAESPELRAVFDRFVIRCRVTNAPGKKDPLMNLVLKGWSDTYGSPLQPQTDKSIFENLKRLRAAIRSKVTAPENTEGVCAALAQMVSTARNHNLSEVSNRRLVKFVHAMLIHRLIQGVDKGDKLADYQAHPIGPDQLHLLWRFFLDNDTDLPAVDKLRGLAEEIGKRR